MRLLNRALEALGLRDRPLMIWEGREIYDPDEAAMIDGFHRSWFIRMTGDGSYTGDTIKLTPDAVDQMGVWRGRQA